MNATPHSMIDVTREPPVVRSFSAAYWEATKDKRLLIQYCVRAGRYQFHPRPVSIFTGRRELQWREVSGEGEVYSYTFVRRAPPPWRGREPFAVALVALDVGVVILSNVVNCELANITI